MAIQSENELNLVLFTGLTVWQSQSENGWHFFAFFFRVGKSLSRNSPAKWRL